MQYKAEQQFPPAQFCYPAARQWRRDTGCSGTAGAQQYCDDTDLNRSFSFLKARSTYEV